jgi:dTMP kinase
MFITFEGLDGSGKTTQVALLASYLRGRGYDVLVTREPGGTAIGDQIRNILHNLSNTAMHPHAELLLFNASRAQLVSEVLRPHLERGGVVICDRYADSTVAYQGYGHGIDLEMLTAILWFATGGLRPDLTLYLDISPESGLDRRYQASLFGDEWTRMDDMKLEFHRRVQQGYFDLMQAEPERWARIDADQPEAQVQAAVVSALQTRLGLGV